MSEYRAKSTEQSARGKEHSLSLRGKAEAILKCGIPHRVYSEPCDKILCCSQNDSRRMARNDKLQIFSNQKGIALVMVLVLSAIALAIMAGLIYMITSGTQISGIQKRYKTALEAGVGGAGTTYQFIALMGDTSSNSLLMSQLSTLNPAITTPGTCTGTDRYGRPYSGLAAKLNTQTSTWSADCNRTFAIEPLTNTTYDMSFDLGITPVYRVFSKIVDTVAGNSSVGQDLIDPTFPRSKTPSAQHFPYLYTIEVDAQNRDNSQERAKLSILYQY